MLPGPREELVYIRQTFYWILELLKCFLHFVPGRESGKKKDLQGYLCVVFAGEHIKVGSGGRGEGAGLLLQQAARGGAAVPRTRRRKRAVRGPANGDPLRDG